MVKKYRRSAYRFKTPAANPTPSLFWNSHNFLIAGLAQHVPGSELPTQAHRLSSKMAAGGKSAHCLAPPRLRPLKGSWQSMSSPCKGFTRSLPTNHTAVVAQSVGTGKKSNTKPLSSKCVKRVLRSSLFLCHIYIHTHPQPLMQPFINELIL